MRRLLVFLDRHLCRLSAPWIPAPYLGTGRAIAGKTNWGRRVDVGGGIAVGALSRDFSAWIPAFAGMTNSEGPELWLGTADSATPHPDPSGGQAPALHFLIAPLTIGLQFGTFRRWRAGSEVDWRAHPGSESGTCFLTNVERGDAWSDVNERFAATLNCRHSSIHCKRISIRRQRSQSDGYRPAHDRLTGVLGLTLYPGNDYALDEVSLQEEEHQHRRDGDQQRHRHDLRERGW